MNQSVMMLIKVYAKSTFKTLRKRPIRELDLLHRIFFPRTYIRSETAFPAIWGSKYQKKIIPNVTLFWQQMYEKYLFTRSLIRRNKM